MSAPFSHQHPNNWTSWFIFAYDVLLGERAMILRRILSNLRNQHWTSLTLELMVLIIGIFIGLQADTWNRERLERMEEQGIIKSLEDEIDNNIAIYRKAVIDSRDQQEIYLNYYNHLMDSKAPRPDEDNLLIALCRVGLESLIQHDNTIYDELVATGRTKIISHEGVRRSLGKYVKLQSVWQKNYDDLSQALQRTFLEIHKFLEWRPVVPLGPNGGFGNCDIDFKSLEANNRTPHHIANIQRISYSHLRGHWVILRDLTILRALLASSYPDLVLPSTKPGLVVPKIPDGTTSEDNK